MTVSEVRIIYPLLTDSRFEEQMQREQDCHFIMVNQLSYLRNFKDKPSIRGGGRGWGEHLICQSA